MSERDDSSESSEDGFFSSIASSGSEYIESVKEIGGSSSKADVEPMNESQISFVKRSSDRDIAQQAYKELRREVGNQDQLPFDEPVPVLREAERQFSTIRDDIIEKLEEITRKDEESVEGSDTNTMLYIIDKNAGKSGQFTLFGGAESLIYNTAEKYGWNKYETELIYKANRIAARQNDLHRHLLLDTVLIVPNTTDIIK